MVSFDLLKGTHLINSDSGDNLLQQCSCLVIAQTYSVKKGIGALPNNLRGRSLLKTLREKEKMLVTSIFSFSQSVFYPSYTKVKLFSYRYYYKKDYYKVVLTHRTFHRSEMLSDTFKCFQISRWVKTKHLRQHLCKVAKVQESSRLPMTSVISKVISAI